MKKAFLYLCLVMIPYIVSANSNRQDVLSKIDTTQVYYINHQEVKNFDGSQLIGERITSYKVRTDTLSLNNMGIRQIHEITFTERNDFPLVLLDGKQISKSAWNRFIQTRNIKTMYIIKDEKKIYNIFNQYFHGKENEMKKLYKSAIIINSKDEQKAQDWYYEYINTHHAIKHPVYIIDGKIAPNFDGSQLVGKIINKYTIENDTAKVDLTPSIKTTHKITTEQKEPIRIRGQKNEQNQKPEEQKYILNGKRVSKTEIEKLAPKDIKEIFVIKGGSKAAEQYKTEPNDDSSYTVITTK